MASKKKKKINKKYYKFFLPLILVILFLALLFILFWRGSSAPQESIFVSSENPQQGDTILLRVNAMYEKVSGSFNNKIIVFSKNGKYSDWVAFLGIDADMQPGKYNVFINVGSGALEKEINVAKKDFPSVVMATTKELKDKGFTEEKIIDNIKNNDNLTLSQALAKFTDKAYFKGPFVFPLKSMQESGFTFGEFIKSQSYKLQHFGVDLRAAEGTKVYSVNSGKVVLAKKLSNYGNTIVVDHGLGIFSMYLHLNEFKIALGQDVKKNQVIGLSGNSGYSTAAHLHFSIRDNGTRVDPILFIKATEKTSENFNLASIARILSQILNISPSNF